MTSQDEILITLAGKTAAGWVPLTNWQRPNPRNLYFWRQRFRNGGIRWATGKQDNAAAQATGRTLATMQREVSTVKASGRTCFAKLTAAGLYRAMALAGLPKLADCLDAMRHLASFDDHPMTLTGYYDGYVSEDSLMGFSAKTPPADKNAWLNAVNTLIEKLLLGLINEWCESNSDGRGRVYYRLLPAGRAAIDNPPKAPKRLPKHDPEARALFNETERATLDEIAQADEKPAGELGFLPISCSPTARGTEEKP